MYRNRRYSRKDSRRIARRYHDGDIKESFQKLQAVVKKGLAWLRNKGRVLAQSNPVVTRLFTMLLSLNAAFNAWGGVTELMATPSKISEIRRYCEQTGRKFSEVTSELPPDQRPLRMLGHAIGTLLRAFAKSLIAREINKMSTEKIQDSRRRMITMHHMPWALNDSKHVSDI